LKIKYDISPDDIYKLLSSEQEPLVSKNDVSRTEEALIRFAQSCEQAPPLSLKAQILDRLKQLEEQKKSYSLSMAIDLPELTPTPNLIGWRHIIKDLQPPEKFRNIYFKILESNDKRDLMVVWIKEDIPDEVHHNFLESFLLVEGACTCEVWDDAGNFRTVRMFPGDVIAFRLGEYHNLINLMDTPVIGIVQRVKLAA
jgi:mannose-6-phosphate isomerase-like protein (cupin superfamily)